MIGLSIFITLLLLSAVDAQNPPYKKIVHNTDPEARCLDGSPAALYLSEGDPNHILMYFVGGASCADTDLSKTVESCYRRSKMVLGSSLYWPQTNTFEGILSNDVNKNLFGNWTKAVFVYCDGAFHQGNSKSPFKYKDTTLYFRGGPITRSHFKYLDSRFSFANAKKVVLTGSSAGGIATYVWADYLKTLLPNPETQYFSVPDSSIFVNPADPMINLSKNKVHPLLAADPLQNLLSLTNKDENIPNSECFAAIGKQNEYLCLQLHTSYLYLKTESLFLQSSYDQYVIRYSAGFTCLSEGVSGYSLKNCDKETIDIIQNYRSYYLRFVQKLLQKGHNIWSISCSWHAVVQFDQFYSSALQKVPETTGKTMQEAVYDFVMNRNKVVQIDVNPWPANEACAY